MLWYKEWSKKIETKSVNPTHFFGGKNWFSIENIKSRVPLMRINCEFHFSSLHDYTYLSNGMRNGGLRAMEHGTLLRRVSSWSSEDHDFRDAIRVSRGGNETETTAIDNELGDTALDKREVFSRCIQIAWLIMLYLAYRTARRREKDYIARAPDVVAIQLAR